MTKKTIQELPDGQAVISSLAVVAFDQPDQSTTQKTSIRPNPPRQVNITSQAQLEVEFGINIEIPDGIAITVSIDDSFVLTKPIKVGDGSSLKLIGSTTGNQITYVGVGAMIQLTNPANPCFVVLLETITLIGPATNSVFDVKGTAIFVIQDVFVVNFDSIGTVDFPQMRIIGLNPQLTRAGLIVKGVLVFTSTSCLIQPSAAHEMTFYSFIQTNPITTSVTRMVFAGATSDDSLIFYDPNSPPSTSMIITECTRGAGNLFQPGTEIAATANAASGSDTQFNITAHNLKVGQVVVLKDFGIGGYNGTFVVTAVNDANSVDIEVGFLGASSGNMDASSLDSTAVQVFADQNQNSPPSMSQAELRQGNPVAFASVVSTFVPFENTIPVAGDFIQDPATERFTVDDETGIITYIGIEPITNSFQYGFSITKSGGGTDAATISLFQNAAQIVKSDKVITLSTTSQSVVFVGLISILPGDTFQLKINSDGVDTVNISNLEIVTKQ